MHLLAKKLLNNNNYKLLHRKNIKLSRLASSQKHDEELEKFRAKMMAKNLPKNKPIEGVKHIIVVSSGKGGVGKSTTSVNLAATLKILEPQKSVGLLDADVFGPSIPLMMNLHNTPRLTDRNLMKPLVNYGVKCMSMGFLIEEGSPVIWRGLMVMQALEKLIRQVEWGHIDYLVVDTPPGTGDTHLSLVQSIPIEGVVLITTPQAAALQVTKRGAAMYKKLDVPIIGLVENMSSVECPKCLSEVRLFGDGTKGLAKDLNVEVLASFPLVQGISAGSDKGVPIVVSQPDHLVSKIYQKLAEAVAKFVNK